MEGTSVGVWDGVAVGPGVGIEVGRGVVEMEKGPDAAAKLELQVTDM